MTENYLTLSHEDRLEALGVAATQSGRPAHLLEKDIWVVWAVDGRTRVAWDFTIVDGKIVHIAMLAAPETLDDLDLTVFE